ncbi:MAG: DUF4055 domain-containing protein [Pseudomonadota bacterium]
MSDVKTRHPDYEIYRDQWRTMRDVLGGNDAIQAGGTTYLPKLTEQSEEAYDAYRERAVFYEATGRTRDGLVGMVFRKPPAIEPNGLDERALNDIDQQGNSLQAVAKRVVEQVLSVGRHILLVDFPTVQDTNLTVAQAERRGVRPTLQSYSTESLINWRVEVINGEEVPTLLVFEEAQQTADASDEFRHKQVKTWRVLRLTEGVYTSQLYISEADKPPEPQEVMTPRRNGQPLNRIPVVFINSEDNRHKPKRPPLKPLADLNISHYRTTADLEHGAHFTGLPQPYATGVELEGGALYIGSEKLLTATNADARFGYMEFAGAGLSALETRLEKKEGQMAAIGARMLAPEKSGVEAAETVAMRHSGESSVLSRIVTNAEEGMNTALDIMGSWGQFEAATIALNREFFASQLTPQEIEAIVGAWQSGAVSKQEMFRNLQQGAVIAEDKSFKDHEEELSEDAGLTSLVGDAPGAAAD